MNYIQELQEWYRSYCNGEWEHDYGIKIETLDNPGWTVEISLMGTRNENTPFKNIKLNKDEDNWIHCSVEDKVFKVACGPSNLEEALKIFFKWTKMTT